MTSIMGPMIKIAKISQQFLTTDKYKVQAAYDVANKTILLGNIEESDIEMALNHEYLHYVLAIKIGPCESIGWDVFRDDKLKSGLGTIEFYKKYELVTS
jgi:hypothetical protein